MPKHCLTHTDSHTETWVFSAAGLARIFTKRKPNLNTEYSTQLEFVVSLYTILKTSDFQFKNN